MKILRVGDPHVMVSNLSDAEKLMDFIIETAIKEKVTTIEFLGDLFHTHAILRVEVVDFWKRVFNRIQAAFIECRVLVGNHDQPGSKEKEQIMNALNIFEQDVFNTEKFALRYIINKPMVIGGIAYIPYMSDKEEFLGACEELYSEGATKLLVAHQTFTGATYENGFYAEDGIDPALVPQEYILSGHIHKQQEIGKCFYQGTPKWDTMSDANEDKGIWIYTHNKDMSIKSKKFISTKNVVTPIYKYTIKEGEEDKIRLKKNAKNYIELVGKAAWITKVKKKYKGKANIKAKPTDRKREFIDKNSILSINQYLMEEFEVINGIDKKDVSEYLRSFENV